MKLLWIACKPILDPLMLGIALYGAFHWEWFMGGFGWFTLLILAPGGHGHTLDHAKAAATLLANAEHTP